MKPNNDPLLTETAVTPPPQTLKPRNTQLCIVWFEPDCGRQERVNIAALLEVVSPSTPFLQARIRPDAAEILLKLDPNLHVELLEAWLEGVSTLECVPERGEYPSRLDAFYEQHQNYMRGPFRIGKPMLIYDVLDNEARLEQFFEHMVLTPASFEKTVTPEVPPIKGSEAFLRFWRKHGAFSGASPEASQPDASGRLNTLRQTAPHYHLTTSLLPSADV